MYICIHIICMYVISISLSLSLSLSLYIYIYLVWAFRIFIYIYIYIFVFLKFQGTHSIYIYIYIYIYIIILCSEGWSRSLLIGCTSYPCCCWSEHSSWEGAQFQKMTLAKTDTSADHVSKTQPFWYAFVSLYYPLQV